ncbi:sulfite exporter TauE/SafE family protein [Kineobactrum salinum]|uniref:Probable membrane transporter protein n=1 Tax=Kineobactrum salinum TaxID=2708301 RepID=A0A6C0U1I3_9GAMM|nr:sulfite exporter TauE/SafE family protein [Kineobactrum salinum]QIB65409.1 sulfite exporter TauE/SafE family protein [Kineobactrum salinum]
MEFWFIFYLILGALTGVLAGLFGVGGGAVMVPVLAVLFAAQGFPSDYIVHLALGTSMAAIVPTSIASLGAHNRRNAVLWPAVRGLAPGILLGTFAATFLAAYLQPRPLAIFFCIFMSYVAAQMILNRKPSPSRQLPGLAGLSVVGAGIGGVSALVALGGGTMTVPFLAWCNVRLQTAIGTSAAVGFPIALAGSAGYILNGWDTVGLPAHTLGFVYWPAVLAMAATSLFFAPLGARLAHRLPVTILRRLFAGLVILLALQMLRTVF